MSKSGHSFSYYSGDCENSSHDPHFSVRALLTDGEPTMLDSMMEKAVPEKCGHCNSDIEVNTETIFWPPMVEISVEDLKETFDKTNGYICIEIHIESKRSFTERESEQLTLQSGEHHSLQLSDEGTYYLTRVNSDYYLCNSDGMSVSEQNEGLDTVTDDIVSAILNRYTIEPIAITDTPLIHVPEIPTHYMV